MLSNLFLVVYAAILRVFGFFNPVDSEYDNGGYLSDIIYETTGLGDGIRFWIAFIFILVQAVFLNLITSEHKITGEANLLPGLFLILFSSVHVSFLGLTPALIGNTALIFAVGYMYGVYKDKEPSGKHFNVGFLTAIAALCYGSYSVFFLYGLGALATQRAFNPREALQILAGFLVPFFLLWVYFFWMGDVNESYFAYLQSSFGVLNFSDRPFGIPGFVALGFFGIMILISVVKFPSFLQKQGVKSKKNINITFQLLAVAGITTLIQAGLGIEHLIVLAIPLGVIFGILFTRMKSPIKAEIWHALLFIPVPLIHFLLK